MALYKHVADKDDLVVGMVDEVVAGYPVPDEGADWRESVRQRVLGARRELLRHPWVRAAIESATRRTPTVLHHMDAVAGELVAGGFTADLTHYAMHALGHRIWGFSPEAFPAPAESEPVEIDQATIAAMADQFPHVVAITLDALDRNPPAGCDEQAEFEFTLDLLLDSFERLRDAGWESRPSAGREG
jgi:AcrR family transcriptional regulator